MRVRNKEIRQRRHRKETAIKAAIKEAKANKGVTPKLEGEKKAAKKPVAPKKPAAPKAKKAEPKATDAE